MLSTVYWQIWSAGATDRPTLSGHHVRGHGGLRVLMRADEGAVLHASLRDKLDHSPLAPEQIRLFRVMNLNYYPRESHLVTLRNPYSFPILYHPGCNNLVRQHIEDLAQSV